MRLRYNPVDNQVSVFTGTSPDRLRYVFVNRGRGRRRFRHTCHLMASATLGGRFRLYKTTKHASKYLAMLTARAHLGY